MTEQGINASQWGCKARAKMDTDCKLRMVLHPAEV